MYLELCIITFVLANLSSPCSDASPLSCLSLLLPRIVALLAPHNSVAIDGSFPSLSFYVVILLAAHHSIVVDCSGPSLSFYVVALLAARHSVVVDCSGPSHSLSFYIVAKLAVVKTYHYDFLPLPLNLKLYIGVTIYTHINAYKCLYA